MSKNMEMEEDEISLDSGVSGTPTKMANSLEKHNLKVRRRNVVETVNVASKDDKDSDSECNVPLVRISDSTRAWYDNVIPRIPDIVDFSSSGKQNGVLNHVDESSLLKSDFGDTETLTNRERMKISVIRGTVVNPDLTLGELRLLGCSSEGLVNGTLLIYLYYYQQGTTLQMTRYNSCIYFY